VALYIYKVNIFLRHFVLFLLIYKKLFNDSLFVIERGIAENHKLEKQSQIAADGKNALNSHSLPHIEAACRYYRKENIAYQYRKKSYYNNMKVCNFGFFEFVSAGKQKIISHKNGNFNNNLRNKLPHSVIYGSRSGLFYVKGKVLKDICRRRIEKSNLERLIKTKLLQSNGYSKYDKAINAWGEPAEPGDIPYNPARGKIYNQRNGNGYPRMSAQFCGKRKNKLAYKQRYDKSVKPARDGP
jgi:hypothetical protein